METDNSARTWAMACHLSALLTVLIPGPAFLNILAPLFVWLVKRNDSPFIDDQGKESVNFQLSVTLYLFAVGLLMLVFGFMLPLIGVSVGDIRTPGKWLVSYVAIIPVVLILLIFDLVEVIIAGIKASNGQAHRYPLRIRFIK